MGGTHVLLNHDCGRKGTTCNTQSVFSTVDGLVIRKPKQNSPGFGVFLLNDGWQLLEAQSSDVLNITMKSPGETHVFAGPTLFEQFWNYQGLTKPRGT